MIAPRHSNGCNEVDYVEPVADNRALRGSVTKPVALT
jgi:hypothetical protein